MSLESIFGVTEVTPWPPCSAATIRPLAGGSNKLLPSTKHPVEERSANPNEDADHSEQATRLESVISVVRLSGRRPHIAW